MYLSDLSKWGIPECVLQRWRERQGELLLPVQSKAVCQGLLGSPSPADQQHPVNVLITAPTSSGKSFCAELAGLKAVSARRRTVMLFPLKSLAEQKYRLFRQTYEPLGIKCLIVTGDHPENDRPFVEGKFQLALAIYEKLDQLLTTSLDSLKNVGTVVVDEIQTIAEPGRGAVLERLLTKILASSYAPNLVGLSAVLGGGHNASAELMASWLRAVLVEETVRPVDLLRGVAAEGSFCYRSYNNHLEGSQPFVRIEAGDDPYVGFANQVKSDDGSTLVFMKSRMDTVNCACRLAAAVDWGPARHALDLLKEEEPSFLVRSLRQAMSHGVAFHNADLSPRQRNMVEQAFIDKEIKTIISTTTLSMGVNLPADTVYLETVKYAAGEYGGKPSLVPVTRCEFDNMTGRAGRLGSGDREKPGRAIVMADSAFEREVLWASYITGENHDLFGSAFDSMPLVDWTLNIIVCGLARDMTGLEVVYAHTLRAQGGDGNDSLPEFESAVEALRQAGLVRFDKATGDILPTALGRASSSHGLSAAEAAYYLSELSSSCPERTPGWLALALSGPGWALPASLLTKGEYNRNTSVKMLCRFYEELVSDAERLVPVNQRQRPTYRSSAALKAFLVLHDWCRLAPVEKLEERFQMHLGQIMSLGETAAHLVTAISALLEATDPDPSRADHLSRYAFTLRYGLPDNWRKHHRHFRNLLSRGDYIALERDGIHDLVQLCELSPDQVDRLIPAGGKSAKINKRILSLKEEVCMQTRTTMTTAVPGAKAALLLGEPESIEIDGRYEKERYLIRVNGFPVWLTGKSFKYFVKLAWTRCHREAGWIYKEDIEQGFNQARYLYRMKNEIAAGLNINWSVIENNRLGYYRLSALPSAIRFSLENLKDHPDFELRQLVLKRISETVN